MSKGLYFIFDTQPIDINIYDFFNIELLKEFDMTLSYNELKRLLGSLADYLEPSKCKNKVYMHVIRINEENNKLIKTCYRNHYYSDCNKKIYNLLNRFDNLIGYPSKYHNNILKCIIFGNMSYESIVSLPVNHITKLKNEDGWESLTDFFNCLNTSTIEYLVLRKFEQFPQTIDSNDKDIDILCKNFSDFIRISNAKKRSIGISGYKIKINGEWISLDVRFVGDNYYDTNWELEMLHKRVLYKDCIYIMDEENLYFSSIYHACTQKKEFPEYYSDLLKKIHFSLIKNNLYDEKEIIDSFICELKQFMDMNHYRFKKPLDSSVVQNKKNIHILKNNCCYPSKKKIILVNILSKLPKIPQFIYRKVNSMK